MAETCKNCGAPLDAQTGLCPRCARRQKGRRLLRGAALLVCAALTLSGALGLAAQLRQTRPVIRDYTQETASDGASGSAPDGKLPLADFLTGSDGGDGGAAIPAFAGGDGGDEAVLSPSVKLFTEEDADAVNGSITGFSVANQGLFLDVAGGTGLDALGVGDVFFLDGSPETPLGEPYFGKVAYIRTLEDGAKQYILETPAVDEVFDVLDFDYAATLSPADFSSIQLAEGVTMQAVDSLDTFFTPVAAEPGGELALDGLVYRGDGKDDVRQTLSLSGDPDKPLLLSFEVDLLKAFEDLSTVTGKNQKKTVNYSPTEAPSILVYGTNTGAKYHTDTCFYLHSSKIEMTLDDAVKNGLTPCQICAPPTMGDDSVLSTSEKLTLSGKVGFESLSFNVDFDWDILHGKGLETFAASADGDFKLEANVIAEMSAALGGKTTTITLPMGLATVKLAGLDEKLLPLAFVTYNGTVETALFPSKEYVRKLTATVPVTIGFMIYMDMKGNVKVQSQASFSYDCDFACTYTGVRDGQWVNQWDATHDATARAAMSFGVSGDADIYGGMSLLLYVFNLNVADLSVVKLGVEGEGNLEVGVERIWRSRTGAEDESPPTSFTIDASYYLRAYAKILGLDLKLKASADILFGLFDTSFNAEYSVLWKDITLWQTGEMLETSRSGQMDYKHVTAEDESCVYFKDTNGALVREARGNGARVTLYDGGFFSFCGIDDSYLYLLVPSSTEDSGVYEICRVSKLGGASRTIVRDVFMPLSIDDTYLYYVTGFDKKAIARLDRGTLKESTFATFSEPVQYMSPQGRDFYVVTKSESIFFFFGGSSHYYLIDSSGSVIGDYGSSPSLENYHTQELDSYFCVKKPASLGYLRNTASEIYWMSGDRTATVLTEQDSGWYTDEAGIFTTLHDSEAGTNHIVLYRAADGVQVPVTDVESDQAFFTLCQSDYGDWYFFDQTDSELILYKMDADLTNKTEVKRFSLTQIPADIKTCGMEITNERIYFYTMPNETTSTVLYRYDII